MSHSYRFFSFTIIFLFSSALFSQQNVRTHSLISGKKEVKVQAITQDRNGIMWVGTEQGLVSYNGIHYKLFQEKDGLAFNSVTALLETNDSTLWIGHSNGKITQLKNQKFSLFALKDTTDNSRITSIISDEKNNIWIATYGAGICKYDGQKITKYNTENGLGDDYVYTLSEAKPGSIWMGTDAGITILNDEAKDEKEKFSRITTKNGLPDNIVHVITTDKNGQIWITMRDSGFCKYNLAVEKIIRPELKNGWDFGTIYSMTITYSGMLFFGTESNGVIKFKTKDDNFKRTPFAGNRTLANQKITCLFEDTEKNIWIGTQNGLVQFCRGRFEFFSAKDGLASDQVRAFLIDSKGNYWLSTPAGLSQFWFDDSKIKQAKTYFSAQGSSGISIVSIFEGKNGNIWLGTYSHGAYLLNPETGAITAFSEKNGLANNNVMSICDDKDGNVWLATLGGGVSKISFAEADYKGAFKIKNYSEDEGAGSIYVYQVFRDSKNNIWLATDGGGLTKYDGNSFTSYNTKTGHLKNDIVYSITEDKKGNIWFSNQENGIYKFDPSATSASLRAGGNSFTNYGTDAGIRDLSPAIVTAGHDNDIIIIHNNGIDVLNESEPTKTRQYNPYESNVEFAPNQNVFYSDKAGNVWIGTEQGIIRFRSELDSMDRVTPQIQFTNLQVKLENYSMMAPPVFDYSHNHFVFEFMGVYLTTPDKVRYKFKLDGYDKDWSMETQNRMASYPNLPHGDYTFMVCAANAEGLWSQPVTYHFTIEPPFWQTWWFWTLMVIFVFSTAYIYTRWKVKKIESEKKILEQKVQDRTKEILAQNKIIEEKNKNITDSINYAKRIQEAILPSQKLVKSQLENSFILYKPKDIVAGDFYWMEVVPLNPPEGGTANTQRVFERDSGQHTQAGGIEHGKLPPSGGGGATILLAACDCTGHGVPGAFVSIVGHNALNSCVKEFKLTQPAKILDKLNELVEETFSKSENDVKDGMDIALCSLSLNNGHALLEYAGANNAIYFIRDGVLKEIKADKQPIGKFAFRKPFTNHSFELKKDDAIYIFSDGYADQFGGPKGKKFKYSQLEKLLVSSQNKTMSEQKEILNKTIDDWKGDLEQVDDICIIGIRI